MMAGLMVRMKVDWMEVPKAGSLDSKKAVQ
jgi:hypothetical protein